jgi:gas vesicle protein
MIGVGQKLFYLIAGTGIGVAIGILFAPSAGQETRENLAQKLDGSDLRERAGATIRNVVDRGKNVAHIGKQRINESIEAGKTAYHEEKEGPERRSMQGNIDG